MDAYVGVLGVDGRNRKLYILDSDGVCLVAPEGENQVLEYTKNLNFALNTGLETNEVGDESNLAADYMDQMCIRDRLLCVPLCPLRGLSPCGSGEGHRRCQGHG